ncbi:hypothetical protein MRB53_028074 [Persea americana]|uniref:Uncharacterized protein n=1 Tax=Persea americana TaxID=3435 RepID=A0ACC2KEH4_PERAE|nr:hypothetical protein MRB53_028074 [Persea americana]
MRCSASTKCCRTTPPRHQGLTDAEDGNEENEVAREDVNWMSDNQFQQALVLSVQQCVKGVKTERYVWLQDVASIFCGRHRGSRSSRASET